MFSESKLNNRYIITSGTGASHEFSAFMSDCLPDFQLISNGLCFPEKSIIQFPSDTLFEGESEEEISTINPMALKDFQSYYKSEDITNDDIFYYTYAILNSEEYKLKFNNNLKINSPRIPKVKSEDSFFKFAAAGKLLGDMHTNYESVNLYPIELKDGSINHDIIDDKSSFFKVEKMKFIKKEDKSKIFYNQNITIHNIPLAAYDYRINGKSALEWVMDRQVIKKDKATAITNDANKFANETMNNPAYPLELFQKVITISLETIKIVKSLPKLDI